MSKLPFYDRENRSLSMREQVIARLRQLNPEVRDYFNEKYLATLQDFALLQALEVAVMGHMDADRDEMLSYMFKSGMDYERQHIAKELTETRRMEAGTLIASWSNK